MWQSFLGVCRCNGIHALPGYCFMPLTIPRSKRVPPAALDALPSAFPDGMVWPQETEQGRQWMTRQLAEQQNAFVALTAEALKLLQASLPPDSRLLAQHAPAPARPAVTTNSAPASVPVPAC